MTSSPSLKSDLALALGLADAASRVSMSYFRRELRQWAKADGSLATEADLAVEDELRAFLSADRPDDAVLGEERGQTGSSGRRWILDGIDGTVDFSAGGLEWGTLIALEVDGRVVVAVCDEPAHGRRYWAMRGSGAFSSQRGQPMTQALVVSAATDLSSASAYVPPPGWTPDARSRSIAEALKGTTRDGIQIDHPALQLAAGGYDIAVFFLAGPWDIAGPSLIVEEAGGRFSDLSGRYDLFSGNALFSNGSIHDDALRIIARAR